MKNLITFLIAFCSVVFLQAQQNFFTLDLSTIASHPKDKDSVIRITENWPGDSLHADGIRLLNTLYGVDYSVTIGKFQVNQINEPFTIPGEGKKADTSQVDISSKDEEAFKSLRTAVYHLFSAREEKEIPQAYMNLKTIINEIRINDLKPQNKADSVLLDSCSKVVAHRPQLDIPSAIKLCNNDVLVLRITRGGLQIVYTIRMPEKQQRWFVHYGFTYAPEYMSPSLQYYSKADTGSTYLITPMNGRNGNFLDNLSPTLQFSYRFLRNRWMISPSLVGGFSLNFTNPSAMFGIGCLVGDNLSLNFGMIATQRYFLKGEYTDDQRIDSSKTFDDLHTKRYVPEWCFSVAFRFDENPFKTEETK